MKKLFFELFTAQKSRSITGPCGDYYEIERTNEHTTLLFADGIGHGIKAHCAALFYVTRFKSLLQAGFTLREAFFKIVSTLHKARGSESPYSPILAARMLNSGEVMILSYEMPTPLFLGINKKAGLINKRVSSLGYEVIAESVCFIEPGESLIFMSDGITQAGIGNGSNFGWGEEGVSHFINELDLTDNELCQLPNLCVNKSISMSGNKILDDTTLLIISPRTACTTTIFTGPPLQRELDKEVTRIFLETDGYKIVCGATTAEITARYLNLEVKIETNISSNIAPPYYYIDGINLVTEGAVTLNQVYNIMDLPPEQYEIDSGVSQLAYFFSIADHINFIVGKALNPMHKSDIAFVQRGILSRGNIIPLIAEKLRQKGKLVTVRFY